MPKKSITTATNYECSYPSQLTFPCGLAFDNLIKLLVVLQQSTFRSI